MGKWTKFKEKFERFVPEAEYQAKVDVVKAKYQKFDIAKLGNEFKSWKASATTHKEALQECNIRTEAISQLLLDRFETAQVFSVRLESGGTLTETPVPYPMMRDEEVFLKWLKKKYPEERLKFPWPSLERLVKHHLEEGLPLPPGVEVFIKNRVKLYGAGGTSGQEEE